MLEKILKVKEETATALEIYAQYINANLKSWTAEDNDIALNEYGTLLLLLRALAEEESTYTPNKDSFDFNINLHKFTMEAIDLVTEIDLEALDVNVQVDKEEYAQSRKLLENLPDPLNTQEFDSLLDEISDSNQRMIGLFTLVTPHHVSSIE